MEYSRYARTAFLNATTNPSFSAALTPRTPKPRSPTRSLRQLRNLLKLSLNPLHNPQLSNPIPRLHIHSQRTKIRHHHPDLPPITRIDHPSKRRNPTHREPRPILDQRPMRSRKLQRNPRWHRNRRPSLDHNRFRRIKIGSQIPKRPHMRIPRQLRLSLQLQRLNPNQTITSYLQNNSPQSTCKRICTGES